MPYPMQMGKTLAIKDVALLMHAYWTLQEPSLNFRDILLYTGYTDYIRKHAVLVYFLFS